ncbi:MULTISPECIES: sensor histidine kinase [Paraburkholderia]|uniref:histidine kinase n=1 Tax=Paraburkholderia podalyriae TaxID=1938811 RepID=A0ABR7PQZ8_9BURK|nr:histidine kinase [Paraburkholderia podalyriae]MBC8748703.1 PAS domain S-box protein [Paraburkholderia podalyriae]
MQAPPPAARQLRLRDLVDAMRKLGIAARLDETRLDNVTDARGAALAVLSAHGVFLSVNRSAAALLGYANGELVGRSLLDMAPEGERASLAAQLSADPAHEFAPITTMLTLRNGRPTLLLLHRRPIASNEAQQKPPDGQAAQLMLFEEPLAADASPATGVLLPKAAARDRLKYLMIGQQRERQRLAAELHDGLGQALTLIKLMVEDSRMRLRRGQAEDAAQKLDATVLQIREAIGEMRQICGELRPLALDRLGLAVALSTLCRRVERSAEGLAVNFRCDVDDRDVPDYLKADIFRLAQEALNNIVKHAAATEIRLTLQRIDTGLLLTVQDNGTGYDTRPLSPEDIGSMGLGLAGMQHRVESQGGFLSIHSSDAIGTLVSASWTL